MRKAQITVLKCAFHEDLVRDHAKPGLVPCCYNREGMEFICETPHETLKALWETVYLVL